MVKVIVFDTETTSIDEPALIEAAGIIINGSPFNEQRETFNNFYNPGKPISFGAMAIHNILDCDIKDYPPASDFCLPDNTAYLVGHNIDFDWGVIGKPQVKLIDTLPMARKLWVNFDSHNLGALSYALCEPDKRPKIREKLTGRHNALIDAELCLELLRYILKEKSGLKSWGDIWRFSEEARVPDVMPFGKHKGTVMKDLPDGYKAWLLNQAEIDRYLKIALRR